MTGLSLADVNIYWWCVEYLNLNLVGVSRDPRWDDDDSAHVGTYGVVWGHHDRFT